jgi:hypothetical protein
MANFLTSIGKFLFPPSAGMYNDDDIDKAYEEQKSAGQSASAGMQEQFDYQKEINQPLIKVGDQQLQHLQTGVNDGRFLPDNSIFQGYQLSTPESYQGQQAPVPYQYQGQQAPGQVGYSQNQFSPYQQTQQQPDIYITPDIAGGNYYDPNQQQFNVQNDPVYQNRIEAANRATEASAAAQGMQLSGSNLKALQQNASTIAGEEGATAYGRYADQQNRLQSAMNYQNSDTYNRSLDMSGIRTGEADRSLNQFNTNRNFGQAASTENLGNALAVQGQNYGQYSNNRSMGLGEYQTNVGQFNENRNFDIGALQYNNQLNQNQDALRYGLLTDQYSRDQASGLQNYGMIGDLANMGVVGRQNLGTAAGDYWGSQADISIGTANAFAAAQAAKSGNDGFLNSLLGK